MPLRTQLKSDLNMMLPRGRGSANCQGLGSWRWIAVDCERGGKSCMK